MSLCPHPQYCGSCGWSHIPYEKQLQQKLSDINGSLKLKGLDIHCDEILPSPVTEHYRNRMDFVIDFEGRVGLRQKGKWWRVIDNHPCFLADPSIDRLFYVTREWVKSSGLTYFDRKKNAGFLRYAVIRATRTGQTMISLITSTPSHEEEKIQSREQFQRLAKESGATTVVWSINPTASDTSFGKVEEIFSGSGGIEENINGYSYVISPHAFFQTNSFGSPILQSTVVEFATCSSAERVLDLFCGSGFFTIPLAKHFPHITGIELSKDAIVDARINAQKNNVEIDFHDAPTEKFNWKDLRADLVILDPPRSGLPDQTLRDLLENRPRTIVYVSCNVKSFAREFSQLSAYYRIVKMRAIDLFPHTPHVELVSLLVHVS